MCGLSVPFVFLSSVFCSAWTCMLFLCMFLIVFMRDLHYITIDVFEKINSFIFDNFFGYLFVYIGEFCQENVPS